MTGYLTHHTLKGAFLVVSAEFITPVMIVSGRWKQALGFNTLR